MKKQYTPKEKARMVLEVLKGEITLNEIATQNSVHPSLLTRWKSQAINGLPDLFDSKLSKTHQQSIANEKEKDDLYKQIGKLSTQIEWLKKKSGIQ